MTVIAIDGRKIPSPADEAAARKDEADKLRRLADDIESGTVRAYVAVAVGGSTPFQAMTSTDGFETCLLARLLDAWAVKQVLG